MAEIRLTGLIGSQPLGALAAFGLLRAISELPQFRDVRLSWQLRGDWIAVLSLDSSLAEEEFMRQLCEALVGRQQKRGNTFFLSWSEDIKVAPGDFRATLQTVVGEDMESARESLGFFASYGSESVTDRSLRLVKPTALHMVAGQQRFLKAAREIALSLDLNRPLSRNETADSVRTEIEAAFSRALFGPWEYKDECHALGWDPATEALHALSAIAPTAAGASSERAAVWLAFEGLPLFPCFPNGSRLQTRGFDRRLEFFSWPIWTPAISVATLGSLLGLPEIVAARPVIAELLPRGIVAIYRCACRRDANGRGTFRNATRCAGASVEVAGEVAYR